MGYMVVLSKRHWLIGALIALVVYTSVVLAVLWRMPTSAQSTHVVEGGIVINLGSGSARQVQTTTQIEQPVEETEAIEMVKVEQAPKPVPTPELEPEVKLETKPKPKPKLQPESGSKPEPKRPVPVRQANEQQKNGMEKENADATLRSRNPGRQADYVATIQAWLHRHKKYPSRARRRHQEGTALLYFVLDRQGNVLKHELRESTGYRLLDREILRMLKRAQPLPPMPASMPQTTLELLAPIQFKLSPEPESY
jgi:protein TonB